MPHSTTVSCPCWPQVLRSLDATSAIFISQRRHLVEKIEQMLLTISIPTFNRAGYLGETLARLIAQVPENRLSEVEILVADNASDDGTEEMCANYATKHDGLLRYIRHPQNLGFDRNLDSLFQKAQGRYVLLVGDDDYPLDGALETLLELIASEKGAPVLTYSYHRLIDNETDASVDLEEEIFRPPQGRVEEVVVYSSGVELLRLVNAPLNAGLTGTLFLRAAWLASDRNSYMGTNFLHLAVGYQVAARHPICIVYRPLFVVRVSGNHRWPTNGELYFGLLKAGRPLVELYPTDIIARRRQKDWAVSRAIATYRCAAPQDKRLVQVMRDSLDKIRLGYWLLDLPLLLLPSFMYQFAGCLKRKRIWFASDSSSK